MKKYNTNDYDQEYQFKKPTHKEFMILLSYIGHGLGTLMLFLGAWLILASVVSSFEDESAEEANASKSVVIEDEVEDGINDKTLSLINEQMKESVINGEIRRQLISFENSASSREINEEVVTQRDLKALKDQYTSPLLDQEDYNERIQRDLNPKSVAEVSPEDKINRRIAQKDWLYGYDQAYKREFVKEFIRRAKEGGYKIKLNKDWDIVDIQEVDRPDPVLFEQ